MPADLYKQHSISVWFLVAVTIGLISIWITPHLPLVDYPQHVAQLTLLKKLFLGETSWSEIVAINYFTPNLAIYFCGLILSTVFSVTTAFKLLISVGYIAFIYTCIQLRKHFKVDPRLDWAFLLPFFGYAYKWGFVTFVISAPIALLFILLADKHAKSPTFKNTILLSAIGLLLLEAHGLMFLFTFGLGSLLVLIHSKNMKAFVINLTPYIILISAFAVLFKLNSDFNTKLHMAGYTLNNGLTVEWGLSFKRILFGLANTVTRSIKNFPAAVYMFTALTVFVTPWLLGLRPNRNNKSALVFFGLVCITILLTPHHTLGTYLIHERFALLLIPSYILLFSAKATNNQIPIKHKAWLEKAAISLLIFGSLASLSFHAYSNFLFKNETLEIDSMLANLEPNHKIFYVIADGYSESNHHDIYIHYPLWYQVNQNGFVEGNTVLGNFASLAPFPVRYKPGSLPKEVEADLNRRITINFEEFRYLIVRGEVNNPIIGQFGNQACKPNMLDKKGKWTIYDTKNCTS